jgi:hypothetical protein
VASAGAAWETARVDVLVAIDAIDDLVHHKGGGHGRRPAVRRVAPETYGQAVERLRAEIILTLPEPGRTTALVLTEHLHAIGEGSVHLPMGGGLMLSETDICHVLDQLREVVPSAIIAE